LLCLHVHVEKTGVLLLSKLVNALKSGSVSLLVMPTDEFH